MTPSPRGPALRLVCINDVYTLENLPRFRSLVARAATVDPADLLLVTLAGDFVAPSLLSSLDAGRGMVDCMNAVPVTHVTFGNHENDIPIEALRDRVREFKGAWLATNLPDFSPALPASLAVEVGGEGTRRVKVGLLGVVIDDPTIYQPGPFGGATLQPASEAALRWARRLTEAEGCACVVALTHQDMPSDRALAAAPQPVPFPVIVGGHEHTVFLEQIGPTWIIKAGSDAVHAAVVDLRWPAEAPALGPDLPRVEVRLEDTAAYPEDAALRARVDGHMKAVRDLEAATLLHLPDGATLSSIGTRSAQTSLGAMICSKLRDALGAEACVFNGGGIRGSSAYQGRFTYGDLKSEIPFDNEVVVAPIPGRVLREAIALTRSRAPSGSFLQADDGLEIEGTDHRLVRVAGAPLDDDRDYRVALVRNFFDGMDHIDPLWQYARQSPHKIPPHGAGREAKVALIEAFARTLWAQLGPFEAIDSDGDDLASPHEIAAAVARVTHQPASDITVELLLKAVDTDRDRKVSRQEDAAARKK